VVCGDELEDLEVVTSIVLEIARVFPDYRLFPVDTPPDRVSRAIRSSKYVYLLTDFFKFIELLSRSIQVTERQLLSLGIISAV
jgi:hypothetical protein